MQLDLNAYMRCTPWVSNCNSQAKCIVHEQITTDFVGMKYPNEYTPFGYWVCSEPLRTTRTFRGDVSTKYSLRCFANPIFVVPKSTGS